MSQYIIAAPRREAFELECEQYAIDPDDERFTVLYTIQDFSIVTAYPVDTLWSTADDPDKLLMNALRTRFGLSVRFCDIVKDMRLSPDPGYAIHPKKLDR